MSDPLLDPRFSKEGCGGRGGVRAAASDECHRVWDTTKCNTAVLVVTSRHERQTISHVYTLYM